MKPVRGELRVFKDAAALARAGAVLFCEQAAAASGDHFVAGLSGGSTPRPLYEHLASPEFRKLVPWHALRLVLGDERFVPPDDKDSNLHMIRQAMAAMPELGGAEIFAVPFEGMTPASAAEAYETELKRLYGANEIATGRPFFDLCLLGMGDDGHTASLLPGQDELLDERERWVLPVTRGRPEARITLTYPVLESSRITVFLVSGKGKQEMLDRILSGDETDAPAARLKPHGRLLWFADQAAAGRWA
jgi:6-phosphogluconolactonase